MKSALIVLGLAASAMAQATVYLIRHGEKPADGSNGLSAQGEQRAQCVKNVFGSSSNYNIGYIIAEQPKSDGSRERPYETVEPLAQSLGLTVDTSCTKYDSDCVANLVNNYDQNDGSANILICWEHDNLSDIVASLGDSNPPTYPDDRFDIIWTDPYSYSEITSQTSEDCPGLDN